MTTASQVVVELRALNEQHDRAMMRSAAVVKAAMDSVEESVDKASAAAVAAAARHEAASEKTAAAQAKAAAAAKAAADATAVAAQKRVAAEQSGTAAALKAATSAEASATRKVGAAQRAAAAAKIAAADEAVAAQRAASAVEAAANRTVAAMGRQAAAGDGGIMRRGGGLQNAALQFQDIIVQAQAGTAATTIFAQQGSQILGAFGPWGAVLGVAAAAVGILAGSLGGFEDAADRAKAAQSAFDAVMKNTKGTLTESEQAAVDLASKLSLVERGLLNIAAQQIEAGIRTQKDALKSFVDEARDAANNLKAGFEQQQAGIGGTYNIYPELLRPFNEALAEINATANPTAAQIDRLLQTIRALATPMKDAGFNTDAYATSVAAAGEKVSGLEVDQKALFDVHQRVNTLMEEGKTAADGAGQAAQNLGLKFAGSAGQVLTLADALRVFASEAAQARSASVQAGVNLDRTVKEIEEQTAAYKAGKEAVEARSDALVVEKARQEAVALAQKEGLGVNDAKSEGERVARLKEEELAAKRTYDANQKLARSRGGAKTTPAERLEIRTDNALTKLQQEIDLNQRLIEVYDQGPAALARAKAAYDALNSARQLGYKIGTAEHAQYVQQFQDLAEQKRQGDLLLTDFAKGAELTKSVMTRQEAYNATLTEYGRLRDEGALKEETYLRLVRDLNSENSGYVEGVQAIGQAIQGGIQGATSFNDALIKIGLSLAQLLLQAALFGNTTAGGPLGGLFSSITGLASGLLGGLGGGTQPSNLPGGMSPTSFYADPAGRAGGGQALPGKIYEVGEAGREWFAPQVPGQVIPNSVIKNAAGGGGGASKIDVTISGARGSAEIERAVAAGMEIAYRRSVAAAPGVVRQHNIRFA